MLRLPTNCNVLNLAHLRVAGGRYNGALDDGKHCSEALPEQELISEAPPGCINERLVRQFTFYMHIEVLSVGKGNSFKPWNFPQISFPRTSRTFSEPNLR